MVSYFRLWTGASSYVRMEDMGRAMGERGRWAAFKVPSERKVGCEATDVARILGLRRGVWG